MNAIHATEDFPQTNQFKMGQLVCLKKPGTMYHVVGMNLYLGYDFCLWAYTLAKPHYGESVVGNGPWQYGRTDIEMQKDVKEDELITAEEAYRIQKQELQAKIDKMTDELAKLHQQAASS